MQKFNFSTKVGILGGGQLGKMLALAAGDWHLPVHMLDKSDEYPGGVVAAGFEEGDFKKYEDVYAFGQKMDVVTIEIEHVNTEALHQLKKEGKIVHPDPVKLDIIKDKGLQKEFYAQHDLPTSPFGLYEDAEAVRAAVASGDLQVPFVQKSRTAGYDGRGVFVVQTESDLENLLPGACLIENLVDIEKELAVVVARNEKGEISAFPTVEMAFHPTANLVEYLLCPAQIPDEVAQEAVDLAKRTIETFELCGLLAVELFWSKSGEILINEVAPRPHNSGHHSIDSCYTSQFEQHLRAILNFPLGSTRLKTPAAMVNLLGADGHEGEAVYEGYEACLAMEGVNLHLYGKQMTRPFRKMGHATVVGADLDTIITTARKVQETLRIIA